MGNGNLKVNSCQINKFTRNIVSGISKGDALLPVILLEVCVTGGRTYQAYQRGGFVESRERLTEETLGAIFWFGGVQAFNKIGDCIGQKIFKLKNLKDIDFSVGKDAVRRPFENYLQKMPHLNSKHLATFKFTKIISSILLANAVIGFVVPKINQAITKKYQSSLEDLDKKVKNKTNCKTCEGSGITKTQSPSFKGFEQTLLSVTNKFENDNNYKLLSTDVGIAGGRAVSTRNKQERREALVRDVGSIYFYIFCKNHVASMFNYLQDGRGTRLDPVSVEILQNHLQDNIKQKQYSPEEFEKIVMGRKNVVIPEKVQKRINNSIISLEDFKKAAEDKKLHEIAQKMSEIQPKIKSMAILTTEQVKDIYTGGLINDPQMLKQVFDKFSGGKSLKETDYYPEKDLRNLKGRMHDYINDIIKEAKIKGKNIDLTTLKRANRINLIKNSLNLITGLAVSAVFLSTIIPKIQYWMTQKTTGENKFPGIQTYKD